MQMTCIDGQYQRFSQDVNLKGWTKKSYRTMIWRKYPVNQIKATF